MTELANESLWIHTVSKVTLFFAFGTVTVGSPREIPLQFNALAYSVRESRCGIAIAQSDACAMHFVSGAAHKGIKLEVGVYA
jgi:hypothetical protein